MRAQANFTRVAHHSHSLDFIKETPVPGKQAAASTSDSAKRNPSPHLHLCTMTQTPDVPLPSLHREGTQLWLFKYIICIVLFLAKDFSELLTCIYKSI